MKRLRQEDETWEADFRRCPSRSRRARRTTWAWSWPADGSLLADSQVEGRPTVNDMATLLAHAMRRPLTGKAHRPRRLHVRGHPQWQELFPHLEELGIEVAVHRELPKVQEAYQGYLRQLREAHRAGMVKPTAEQQSVEKLFPAIAQWVQGYGHIEIGDQESVRLRRPGAGLRRAGLRGRQARHAGRGDGGAGEGHPASGSRSRGSN